MSRGGLLGGRCQEFIGDGGKVGWLMGGEERKGMGFYGWEWGKVVVIEGSSKGFFGVEGFL